jgi:hypothetical protein
LLRDTSGANLFVGFHLFGTFDEPKIPDPVLRKLLCHVLVEQLPENGLAEAVESLTGIYEYYRDQPKYLPEVPARLPSISGRITGEYVRPVAPLTEE